MDMSTRKRFEVRGKVRERKFRRAVKRWEERRLPVLLARARLAGVEQAVIDSYMRLDAPTRYRKDQEFMQVILLIESRVADPRYSTWMPWSRSYHA